MHIRAKIFSLFIFFSVAFSFGWYSVFFTLPLAIQIKMKDYIKIYRKHFFTHTPCSLHTQLRACQHHLHNKNNHNIFCLCIPYIPTLYLPIFTSPSSLLFFFLQKRKNERKSSRTSYFFFFQESQPPKAYCSRITME